MERWMNIHAFGNSISHVNGPSFLRILHDPILVWSILSLCCYILIFSVGHRLSLPLESLNPQILSYSHVLLFSSDSR